MTDPDVQIQLRRLAGVLQVPVEVTVALDTLDAADLEQLRVHIVNHLRDRYARDCRHLNTILRWFPRRLAVRLAAHTVPAKLLGRSVSAALRADSVEKSTLRLLSLLPELDPCVVSDAAPYIDPRVIGRLAQLVPPEMIGDVMTELMRRDDFVTLDLFAEHMAGGE